MYRVAEKQIRKGDYQEWCVAEECLDDEEPSETNNADRDVEYEVICVNALLEVHPPRISHGVIGCEYENSKSFVCLLASSNKRYKKKGIVKDSILFVQPTLPFEEGKLNVFKTEDSFMVSEVMEDKEYIGRTVMVVNQFE